MPYAVHTSLEPRFCPRFACEPHSPKVDHVRPNGAMLDPAEVPRLARQISPHKNIPDVIVMAGCWCVSEPFRTLVEAREPGVHAFYRLPLYRRDASAIEQPYYLFDVRQQIDAVDLEHSDVTWWDASPGVRVLTVGSFDKLAIDADAVAGRHVWRGKIQLSNQFFFSDDLVRAIEGAKLTRLRLERTRTSDEPAARAKARSRNVAICGSRRWRRAYISNLSLEEKSHSPECVWNSQRLFEIGC